MAAPGVGVAAIVVENARFLLVRRRNAPAQGLWAFPGGRLELGESLHAAVCREVLEECGLVVGVVRLVDVIEAVEEHGDSLSHWVLAVYLVDRIDGAPVAGDDAAELRWVSEPAMRDLPTAPGVLNLAARMLG
jgi:mutator protein MutT